MDQLVRHAPRSRWLAYGVAVVAPFVAFLVRLPLAELLAGSVPYITFFLATAVSATYGGFGPGVLSTVLGAVLSALFIVESTSPLLFTVSDCIGLALFLSFGTFISYLAGQLLSLRRTFQQTLLSIGDAVIATDTERRITLMNSVAEELTGWKAREARGRHIKEVFRIAQEGSDTAADNPVDQIFETGHVVGLTDYTELIRKNGERIPIDDSGSPILNESGRLTGTVLIFRNITERRRAQQKLVDAERRARTILESISDAFILLDHEWRYTQVNSTAEKIMGVPAGALIGKVHWEEHPATLGTPVETQYRKAVAEGVPVHFENHYAPWDLWFDIRAYPSSEGLAVYFRDITERKRADVALLRLNEDLKQFTFAATHDVREPLRMITIYVQRLQQKLGAQLDDEANGFITHVVTGAQRIARLLDGLLQFSRMGEIDITAPSPVSAEAALQEALEDLEIPIAEAGAEISHDPLPMVIGDQSHVCQVFQTSLGTASNIESQTRRRKFIFPPGASGSCGCLQLRMMG